MRWGMHRSAFRDAAALLVSAYYLRIAVTRDCYPNTRGPANIRAATPAVLSTISLHDDVEAPPPFNQDTAARRPRRLPRLPVVDRRMAGLVGGAQSREHRLLGGAPFRFARKISTRRIAAALAAVRADLTQAQARGDRRGRREVHATRRLRLGRHASRFRKELAARPHRRGRLDHQPATRQKSLSLRSPQYLAQGGRGLHHRADGTDDGQAAHPRDLSQRRRVGRRRVRRRGRGKTLLRCRRVGVERRAGRAARRHAAQPALLRPPSPDTLSQPPHRRHPRAYAGRHNSALTYMRREWRNAAIRSRARRSLRITEVRDHAAHSRRGDLAPQRLHRGRDPRLATADEHNLRALRRQRARCRPAAAGRRPGAERAFIFYSQVHEPLSCTNAIDQSAPPTRPLTL